MAPRFVIRIAGVADQLSRKMARPISCPESVKKCPESAQNCPESRSIIQSRNEWHTTCVTNIYKDQIGGFHRDKTCTN